MKRLYITSTVDCSGVASSIYKKLGGKKLHLPFIMTPAEPESHSDLSWLQAERDALAAAGFAIFDYTITGKTKADFQHDLASLDALYVCGGNEFYFKYRCNETGFGDFIRKWVSSGKPYIGTSAGSMILAPDMSPSFQVTDTNIPDISITDYTGLNLVNFLIMPHWGSKEFRDLYLDERKQKMYATNNKLILLNNYQYVEVVGEKYRIIDVRHEL